MSICTHVSLNASLAYRAMTKVDEEEGAWCDVKLTGKDAFNWIMKLKILFLIHVEQLSTTALKTIKTSTTSQMQIMLNSESVIV